MPELPSYLDNIRDDGTRYMASVVEEDYTVGRFMYWWSAGDVTYYHFERQTFDVQSLEVACDHLLRTRMPARQDITAQPNYTEIDLGKG
jgi:hypothetical protein